MRPTKNKGSLWIFQAQPKHSRHKVRVHCGPVARALGRDTNAPCEMCISLECQLACAGSVPVCEQLHLSGLREASNTFEWSDEPIQRRGEGPIIET